MATVETSPHISSPPVSLKLRPRKHPVQLALGIVVAVAVCAFVVSLLINKNLQWNMVLQYLFDTHVLRGIVITLALTVICQCVATAIGICLAVMKLSSSHVLRIICDGYLWFFRGTPLLVQLIFWYNLAALFPYIFLGIPFTDFGTALSTNALISGFSAAILGFSLHEGAYMAEIVRAGIMSVNSGQKEAALSTGMTEGMAMRRIILPQAMRVIIPPTGNQMINLLKATSLVAFISGGDLLSNVKDIYSVNFAVMPLLIVASLWYLALVSVASIIQGYLERAVNRGYAVRNTKTKKAASRLTLNSQRLVSNDA